MIDRRLLMRIMLWSLGVAAVAGVAAMLLGGDDVIIRVMITALATATASLLMLPVSKMIDRQASRASGLFGMGAILFEFLIVLVLTWEIDRYWLNHRVSESLFLTMFWGGWAAVLAMVFLKLKE